MSEIRIYPDIPPKGTYDPVDDVIKSAQQIPGFVEVIKNQYYREWDITFVFDDQVITKRDAQRKIDNLHKAFRDKWGQPMTDTTTPRCPSCGGVMTRIDNHGAEYWQCHRDRTIVTDAGEAIYALMDKLPHLVLRGGTTTVPTPARVPCPACEGEGDVRFANEHVAVYEGCTLCRTRGTVPPALAAAWRADEEG